MASGGICFNMKVVRLVETVDFDIKIILIRGRMQHAAESFRTDLVVLIGETELVRKFTRELAMLTR